MVKGEKIFISNYLNKTAKFSITAPLSEELNRIQNGYVKTQIENCRVLLSQGYIEKYKEVKGSLPGVTYSGIFSGAHRAENLTIYSKLMIIDFDGLDPNHIQEQKTQLFKDQHVLAAWVSPSNLGLKVLIRTDSTPDTHKIYFYEVCNYLADHFNLQADKSGSDICRICFTSYDPEILIKEDCVAFSVDLSKIEIQLNIKSSDNKSLAITDFSLDKTLFYASEGRNSKRDRNTIDKIIKYLRNRNLSVTSSYQDWYRVGLAIANTFTYELGKKYYLYLCELDGINHDEYKSINLLNYCYRNRKIKQVNFSTIIYLAEQKGFKLARGVNKG